MRTLSALLPMVLLIVTGSCPDRAVAQLPSSVDIRLEGAPDTLYVSVRANDQGFGGIANVFFTVRWLTSSGATLGPHTSFCPGALDFIQQPLVTDGPYSYVTFTSVNVQPMSSTCPSQTWPADQWRLVMHILPNGPCTPFAIVNDAFTASENRDYFVSTNGVNTTGVILSGDVLACDPLDCLGVPGGTALPGTPCDDGSICTSNDVYDCNCACRGDVLDADNDGYCDPVDDCPSLAGQIGSSCDDGNAATVNDVITAACICEGQVPGGCSPSQLTTTADPVISCGATNLHLNGTSSLWATEVLGANRYQFQFSNVPGQPAYTRNISSPTRSLLLTNWTPLPLKAGRSYNVVVRASFDNGANWCPFGNSCMISISSTPMQAPEQRTISSDLQLNVEVWPNPNNGERMFIDVGAFGGTVTSATLSISDLQGRLMYSSVLEVPGSETSVPVDLNGTWPAGTYVMELNAGDHSFVRLFTIAH